MYFSVINHAATTRYSKLGGESLGAFNYNMTLTNIHLTPIFMLYGRNPKNISCVLSHLIQKKVDLEDQADIICEKYPWPQLLY